MSSSRTFIATVAYTEFVVLLIAVPFLPRMLPVVIVLYVIALVAQRSRPVLIVLRRFGKHSTDFALIESILLHFAQYARVLWIEDQSLNSPLISVRRFTPLALLLLLLSVVSLFLLWQIQQGISFLYAFILALYVFISSWMFLEYSIGAKPYWAFSYFAVLYVIARGSIGVRVAEVARVEQGILRSWIFIIASGLGLASIRYFFSPRTRIKSMRRLESLEKRLSGPLRLKSRVLSLGPALTDRIEVLIPEWQRAVTLFLAHSRYIAIDISSIDVDSGLAWEVQEAQRHKVRVFYICRQASAEKAREALKKLTGEARHSIFEYGNLRDDKSYMQLHAAMKWLFQPEKTARLVAAYKASSSSAKR